MAESINIPIKVISKEALRDLQVISAEVKKINKNFTAINESQNTTLRKTRKELSFLTTEYKAVGSAAGALGAIVLTQNKEVRKLIFNFLGLAKGFNTTTKNLLVFQNSARVLNKLYRGLRTATLSTVDITGRLADAFVFLDKGLIGFSLNLATLSAGLFGVSKAFELFDNEITETIADILLFSSILTGSLSIALISLIKFVGDLSFKIGTTLANAAQKATETFIEFDKKTFVFERTVKGFNKSFGDSIGTVESWTKAVKELSDETAFTEQSLRGAVTEIVATTSAMGFNEDQQRKLLEITADYARFLGDDVVQTTIEFISALNGQAQSVQKYGVKLGAANIQQKIYKKGVDLSFKSLTEAEKVQFRWNSLLEQSIPIQGTAVDVTKTLAGQQKVLNNNIMRLSQSFGEGAAIIENNNLVAAALNIVISDLSEGSAKLAGFFSSLIGRFLQFSGALLTVSFNVFGLIKGIKILNILLETELITNLFNLPIPFINKSLTKLIKTSGATYVSFKSLTDIFKTFGSVLAIQFKVIISGLLGVQVASISLSTVLKGVLVRSLALTKAAFIALRGAVVKLLANPIVLTIAAIAAALFALFKALQVINERTGIFTELWDSLVDSFKDTVSIFKPLVKSFKNFGKILVYIAKDVFGLFVFGVAKVISSFLSFIKLVSGFVKKLKGFSLFANAFAGLEIDETQIDSIERARDKLDTFSDSLFNAGFEFDKLKNISSKAASDINKDVKKIDLKPLLQLQEELKDIGLTDIDKLKRQRAERLKVIQEALQSEGKAFRVAKELERKINLDFNTQLSAIRKSENDERLKQEEKRLEFIENYKKSFAETEKEISGILAKIGQSASSALTFAFGGGKTELEKELEQSLEELEQNFNAGRIGQVEFELEKREIEKQRDELAKSTYLGITTGILNSIAKGAEGAKDIIVSSIQAGLNRLVPGLGDALGPIINAFASGPEATKKMVNDFADAIPVIIENIILSIPAFLEAFADKADVIVERLAQRLPRIIPKLIVGLIRGVLKSLYAIYLKMPAAALEGFISSLKDGISQAWELGLKDAFSKVAEYLKTAFNFLKNIFYNLGKKIFEGLKNSRFGEIGTKLFEAGKKIYEGLKSALERILNLFFEAGKKIYEGLKSVIVGLGKILFNLGKKIFDGLKSALEPLFNIFYNLGKKVFEGLFDILRSGFSILSDLFKKIFKFDGGGTGVVEDFLGFDFPFIAFNKGGKVPGTEKVPGDSSLNDTVPALLSAGEMVIPKSAMRNGITGIFSFLEKMGYTPKGYFLGDIVESVGGFLTGAISSVVQGVTSFVNAGGGAVDTIFSPAGDMYTSAANYLSQFAEYLANPKVYYDILKSLARIGASIDIEQLFTNPIHAIKKALLGVTTFFQPFFRQIIGGGLPFKDGGLIPKGFNNDNFPARLTSGELVIDRSTTKDLQDFLSAQNSPTQNNDNMIGLLSQILNTLQMDKTVNTSVEFNGDTLADIILELNRNNARIA